MVGLTMNVSHHGVKVMIAEQKCCRRCTMLHSAALTVLLSESDRVGVEPIMGARPVAVPWLEPMPRICNGFEPRHGAYPV